MCIYNEEQLEIMLHDIEICKNLGVDGVVFGVLNEKSEIDVDKMKKLISAASPLKVTFHMAFDQVSGDHQKALETLISLGVTRVLTKGFAKNALEGKENLRKLVEWANGRIAVMAGGGVTDKNYKEISEYTKVKELHGTKIVGIL